jgi:hypothetical protein
VTERGELERRNLKDDARVALKKLRMGYMPDPENYLASFVGTECLSGP